MTEPRHPLVRGKPVKAKPTGAPKPRKDARGHAPVEVHRKRRRKPPPEMARCYFCRRDVAKDEFYCFGCNEVICDPCDTSPQEGMHSVDDHQDADDAA